jgi:DNA-binding protein H-NS
MLRKIDRFKNVVQEQEKELEQKTGFEANMDEDIRSIEEVLQKVGNTRKQS